MVGHRAKVAGGAVVFDRAVRLRLGRVLAAQVFAQLVTIGVQLALVPVLLHAWGVALYGAWLLMAAVPFYLTFSDFGFTFVAKNEMVMAVAAGRRDAARATFQSVFALLLIATPVVLTVAAALIFCVDVAKVLSLGVVSTASARFVLLLLVLNVLLYQYFLLICAGIRSENRPATEATWAAASRLGEGAAIALAALGGGGVVMAAALMVANRLLFLVGAYGWLRRASPWLHLGLRDARREELRRLLSPATAYMLLPLGQALLIQGPVLIVGAVLGPLQVVIFSTSRTLARIGTAATNMLNNVFVTEYSALAGAGRRAMFAKLFWTHLAISAVTIAAYMLGILLVARPAMAMFTHGKVPVVQPFFTLIMLAVCAEMLWSALFTPITAVNHHRLVTALFLLAAVIGLALSRLLAGAMGLAGVAVVLLAVNGAMVPVCAIVARRFSHRSNIHPNAVISTISRAT